MNNDKKKYVPNQVSLSARLLRMGGALVLIVHGVIGVVRDDVIIPTKKSALHLHGLSGWIVALSMFCAALVLLSVVFDHYDRRDNEAAYKQFGRNMARLAWGLMGLGMALHVAGIHYPGASSPSTLGIVGGVFVFLCTIAMAYANEKAIERERNATTESMPSPVAVPTPQRAEKASAAVARGPVRLDRTFAGLFLMIVGALIFLAALPGLIRFLVIQYAVAAIAISMMVAGWLVFSGRRAVSSTSGGASPTGRRNWRPIRIGVILVVGLAAIWYVKSQQWGPWRSEDVAEHQAAPAWTYALEEFSSDVLRSDVEKTLGAAGFRVRCYGNLQPQERMNPADTEICWTIASSAFGIPSRKIFFAFGSAGLHAIRIDFPREEWPAVERWYEAQGVVVPGDFGRDNTGAKVLSRRGKSGLVMTASPTISGWFPVVFNTRELFMQEVCAERFDQDPQWLLICRDWPPVPRPSGFVLRSRPQLVQASVGVGAGQPQEQK